MAYCLKRDTMMMVYCLKRDTMMITYRLKRDTIMMVYCLKRGTMMMVYCLKRATMMMVYCLKRDTMMMVYCLKRETMMMAYCLKRDTMMMAYCLKRDTMMMVYCLKRDTMMMVYCLKRDTMMMAYCLKRDTMMMVYCLKRDTMMMAYCLKRDTMMMVYCLKRDSMITARVWKGTCWQSGPETGQHDYKHGLKLVYWPSPPPLDIYILYRFIYIRETRTSRIPADTVPRNPRSFRCRLCPRGKGCRSKINKTRRRSTCAVASRSLQLCRLPPFSRSNAHEKRRKCYVWVWVVCVYHVGIRARMVSACVFHSSPTADVKMSLRYDWRSTDNADKTRLIPSGHRF